MVEWSKPAQRDLKQIHDYIAKDSKHYAKKVVQTIVENTEKLEDYPEIDDATVRELFVYSYRLIYEISPDGIEILAVIHGKRDFFNSLNDS